MTPWLAIILGGIATLAVVGLILHRPIAVWFHEREELRRLELMERMKQRLSDWPDYEHSSNDDGFLRHTDPPTQDQPHGGNTDVKLTKIKTFPAECREDVKAAVNAVIRARQHTGAIKNHHT